MTTVGWSRFADRVHVAALTVLGQPIVYYPAASAAVSINGIFQSAHTYVDLELNAEVSSNHPIIDVRLSDLPGDVVPREDRVDVGGVRYVVQEEQRDGHGMARLVLNKDSETQ